MEHPTITTIYQLLSHLFRNTWFFIPEASATSPCVAGKGSLGEACALQRASGALQCREGAAGARREHSAHPAADAHGWQRRHLAADTYQNTYMHAYRHTDIQTYRHADMQTYIDTDIHRYIDT